MSGPERGVRLARHTTLGTGGQAALFARPESLAELEALVALAGREGLPVETIGLGSNVLAADAGVEALVLRLGGALARVRVDGDLVIAGGGATNAVCLHHALRAGLGGFEFAAAIPGTLGGGVRMNAGAYGSDFAALLVEATIVSNAGTRRAQAAELALAYRGSAIAPGEVVAEVRLRLVRRDPAVARQTVAALLAQRKATQPTTKRTFGSVFKNPAGGPGAGALVEAAGLKGRRAGGAVISTRHANFIENAGGATSADALALMALARSTVAARFGVRLEPEVALLGEIALPPL